MMDPEKKSEELSRQCQDIISKALKAGADEVAVSASFGLSSRIGFEKNDFNIASSHEGTGFSIGVHKDQKSGSASINSLDPQKISETIELALAMAKYSIEDKYLGLAPKSEYIDLPKTFDQKIQEVDSADLLKLAEILIGHVKKDSRISLDGAGVDSSVGVRVIANSLGMDARDYSTSISWNMMGMAIEGEDVTGFDYLGDFSYDLNSCPDKIIQSSEKLAAKLLACLGSQKGQSFKGNILLPASLVEEFLIDPLVYHICGGNIMDGKSRLSESLGQVVCNEALTLEDRPHDAELRGCTAFSGEGVPTSEMTLIEKGVLKKHLDSVYTANKRKTTPTGNGGGPHSPFVPVGSHTLDELKNQGGLCLEMGRFSGNVDSLSGDFSGVAKSSHLYENGKNLGPVREVMVSGNVFEIAKAKILFSNEHETDGGCYRIPHALVEGVSVTAG